MLKKLFSIIAGILIMAFSTKCQQIQSLLQDLPRLDIRGMSVVDDSVAWISGIRGISDSTISSKKTVVWHSVFAITTNGGRTWKWQSVKGYEKFDFRGVEAFSAKNAVIMSSGTPAVILKTTDGGLTWQERYRNTDTAYFLDAIAFDTPKHGLVLGDPIKNKFLLLETNDGAQTWHPFKNPPDAMLGEAAFAASSTCLRFQDGEIHIVSGGTVARHLTTNAKSKQWYVYTLPIAHGQASKGAFSIAVESGWVVVGGDYSKDKTSDSVSCTFDGSLSARFNLSKQGPAGFQSCVESISNSTFLSTGTSGSNFSTDGGITWIKIESTRYNVCRKAKKGKLVLLAGDGGKIGKLIL